VGPTPTIRINRWDPGGHLPPFSWYGGTSSHHSTLGGFFLIFFMKNHKNGTAQFSSRHTVFAPFLAVANDLTPVYACHFMLTYPRKFRCPCYYCIVPRSCTTLILTVSHLVLFANVYTDSHYVRSCNGPHGAICCFQMLSLRDARPVGLCAQ